jgi:transposase-like protein
MEDYPRTLTELERGFGTEAACRDYLLRLRWPDGFECPQCGSQRYWATKRGLLMCRDCEHQASATAGTIFQDSHKPLALWFRAIWWVTRQKTGASALGLQRVLGLGSYRTAWAWLHKLRRAMVRPGRERLSGRVEVDETCIGGPEPGLRGRRTQKKAWVLIAAEEDGDGIGRIRMGRVPDGSKRSLHRFVAGAVEPGSVVHTDSWRGYAKLGEKGYRHEVSKLKIRELGKDLLPRVHRVASLLKRWLLGTHQGAVRPSHLDYYLDEFTFRFNRRTSRNRGKLFYRLIQQAAAAAPAPYETLTAPPQ